MNKYLTIPLILLLFACSSKNLSKPPVRTIPLANVIENEGIIYEKNSQTPFTGRLVKYHSNGQLSFVSTYLDGLEHGPYIRYFDNGDIKLKTNYEYGKEHGVHLRYRRGKVTHQKHYVAGKLHGITKMYYPDGQLRETVCYIEGKLKTLELCSD